MNRLETIQAHQTGASEANGVIARFQQFDRATKGEFLAIFMKQS